MKKKYEKPNVEYIAFYTDEEIAKVLPLEENIEGGMTGSNTSTEGNPDWV